MKTPKLGAVVLFAVLSNEPAQSFQAATGGPVGDAVIQPTSYPGGFRAATVVGVVGDGKAGRVALLVYKQPGDPYREDADAHMQRLGDVPYSAKGIPGTWLYEEDADALAEAAAVPVKFTLDDLTAMQKDDLFEHAAKQKIDLGGVTTKTAALPIVAKHHGLEVPA